MDQKTGEDLNPAQTKRLRTGGDVGTVGEVRNPERPTMPSFVPEAPDLEQVSHSFAFCRSVARCIVHLVIYFTAVIISIEFAHLFNLLSYQADF